MKKLNKVETKKLWEALEAFAVMSLRLAAGEKLKSPWTGKRLTKKEVKHFHFMTYAAHSGRCMADGFPVQHHINKFTRELNGRIRMKAVKARQASWNRMVVV